MCALSIGNMCLILYYIRYKYIKILVDHTYYNTELHNIFSEVHLILGKFTPIFPRIYESNFSKNNKITKLI